MLLVVSRYAARASIGRLCADMEPMGGSSSSECGEDRSLEWCSHPALKQTENTDQKRTDLSELPEMSS